MRNDSRSAVPKSASDFGHVCTDPVQNITVPVVRFRLTAPALDGPDVGGVLQDLFLLLQSLGQLGPAVGNRVVATCRDAGEGGVLGDRNMLQIQALVHGWTCHCHTGSFRCRN
jgi:hypothetical protein